MEKLLVYKKVMIRIVLDSATQYAHADINLILTINGIGEYLTSIHNILSTFCTLSPNIPEMYLSSFSYLPGGSNSVTRHLMDQSADVIDMVYINNSFESVPNFIDFNEKFPF